MATAGATGRDSASSAGISATQQPWSRFGSWAALVGAAGALTAAVAGGITEPTGITTVAAVLATGVAYGLAPLALAVALRQTALSAWWGVGVAAVAATTWSAAVVLFLTGMPGFLSGAAPALEAIVNAAPATSALWLIVASAEVVRVGLHRWSLVVIGVFTALLILGSVVVELPGFDIRKVLVPIGWAVWMIDVGRAIEARTSQATAGKEASVAEAACTNCGAPRRSDGLAFCGSCGLPYGPKRS